jgi:pathogenesis-related protein 1
LFDEFCQPDIFMGGCITLSFTGGQIMNRQLVLWTGCFLFAGSLAACIQTAMAGRPAQTDSTMNANAMLAAHNQWRAKAGVPQLQWSAKLAAVAQEWATHLAAAGCGQTNSGSEYGENLYWASAVQWSDGANQVSRKQPKDVVDSWGKQQMNYDYASNSCQSICGNYTQLVWKDSREVGCGMAVCGNKGQIWVCNYFPAGNVTGKRPY